MAHVVTSIIEGVFNLVGSYVIDVDGNATDIGGASDDVWYRIALARTAATGATSEDPKSFSSHLDTVFAGDFTLRPPTATARVAIRREMASGPGTIDWDSTSEGEIIRDLLGYTSNLSFAAGETIEATYPPAYRLALIGASNDTDWQPEGVGVVYTETDDGKTYGLESGLVKQRRQFTLEHHVRDVRVWTNAPFAGVFPNTPLFPDPQGAYVGKMTDQTEDLPTSSPPVPFTVLDFWGCNKGRPLAMLLFTFQQVIVGAEPLMWDEVYFDKRTSEQGPLFKLRNAKWNRVFCPGPWGFTLVDGGAGVTPATP